MQVAALESIGILFEDVAQNRHAHKIATQYKEKEKTLDFYNQAPTILRSIGERPMQAYTFNNLECLRCAAKSSDVVLRSEHEAHCLHTCCDDEVMARLAEKPNDDAVKAGMCLVMLHSSVVPMESAEVHRCVCKGR